MSAFATAQVTCPESQPQSSVPAGGQLSVAGHTPGGAGIGNLASQTLDFRHSVPAPSPLFLLHLFSPWI